MFQESLNEFMTSLDSTCTPCMSWCFWTNDRRRCLKVGAWEPCKSLSTARANKRDKRGTSHIFLSRAASPIGQAGHHWLCRYLHDAKTQRSGCSRQVLFSVSVDVTQSKRTNKNVSLSSLCVFSSSRIATTRLMNERADNNALTISLVCVAVIAADMYNGQFVWYSRSSCPRQTDRKHLIFVGNLLLWVILHITPPPRSWSSGCVSEADGITIRVMIGTRLAVGKDYVLSSLSLSCSSSVIPYLLRERRVKSKYVFSRESWT